MKPICLIAARGGSKRVPKKNIKILAGKPLIAYTIESAVDSNIFSSVIVSTEDNEIARVAKRFGAEVPFIRPTEISQDLSICYDFIKHSVDWLNDNEAYKPTLRIPV